MFTQWLRAFRTRALAPSKPGELMAVRPIVARNSQKPAGSAVVDVVGGRAHGTLA